MRQFYSRIHPRWKQYDYTLPGTYFVTVIARAERDCSVWSLVVAPCSHAGLIVRDTWERIPERFPRVELDAFVVMPDHVHALILMRDQREGDVTAIPR